MKVVDGTGDFFPFFYSPTMSPIRFLHLSPLRRVITEPWWATPHVIALLDDEEVQISWLFFVVVLGPRLEPSATVDILH